MKLEDIQTESILLECISGSRAQGLAGPDSDTDIKGVFALPRDLYFGLGYVAQLSDERNDTVYYELGRFVELLLKNNPNILELLGTPEDSVRVRHPLLEDFTPELFLSKLCKDSFGGYAFTQIKKARGLNKKVTAPVAKEKKTVLDFSYVIWQGKSYPLLEFLEERNLKASECGLTGLPNCPGVYALYDGLESAGGLASEDGTQLTLARVPEDAVMLWPVFFNKNGYTAYTTRYRDYWDWVENRNEERYRSNVAHGKNYDAKNLMHTFRLLAMAEEIAVEGRLRVRRPDRDFLLSIKSGQFEYDELIQMAEAKMESLSAAYEKSSLPETPDVALITERLVHIREELYT